MFKILYLIFGRISSSESVIDAEILIVLSPKHFTFYFFFSLMARIPRRDHTNSHCDVETFEKCLGRTPLAHVSVCVCCFSYQIFRKIGGKSKPQTVFLLFSNPLRSDKILESKVGCSVIPILEMSPCPAEVSCATGSSDGNATFTPNPTSVWHIGGPRGGRSLFALSLCVAVLVPVQQVKHWQFS